MSNVPNPIAPSASPSERLRTYFLTGLVVAAPIILTAWLVIWFVNFVDQVVTPLIPPAYNPEAYLPFTIPGLGLVIILVALTLLGFLTYNFIGRRLLGLGERIVGRMPIVRTIYGASKQMFETLMSPGGTSFRQVVLIEFPLTGMWTVGFIASNQRTEVHDVTGEDIVTVYLPMAPPMSGYVIFVPRERLRNLDMTPEEALKLCMSGGLVMPSYPPAASTVALAPEAAPQPDAR
ncbi:DUF502 domain-containing protein [Zavarzinia sp. CC-PAN008]|uniref:DUF502 domain-containing protein n=1 Tax=Zavarzinia sp. CC-PAN008 TaxID=3243332 RepID=UPI003F7498EF